MIKRYMNIPKKLSQPLKFLLKNVNVNVINIKTDFFIHNTFVLYFFFVVSLFYIFYLAFQKEFLSVSVFILFGFIASFFTKNMIIILFLALTFTGIYRLGGVYNLEGFTGDTDEDAENKDMIEEPEGGENNEDMDENTFIKQNEKKKEKNMETQQESMIADPEELDTDSNLEKADLKTRNKIKGVDEDGLNKIQEQTRIILDTHNELIKNLDALKPYLREADSFSKSITKIMNGSNSAKMD